MKRVFYINDQFENKVNYYHLLLFLLALPFDRIYTTLIIISYIAHTLIFFTKKDLDKLNSTTFILQSVFFVTLLSAMYAPVFTHGLDVITRQLAILLFPVILTIHSQKLGDYRNRLLTAFSLSNTITILYLYFDAVKVIRFNHLPLSTIFTMAFVNHNFSLPIGIHATYLSMLLVLSLIYSIQQLTENLTRPARLFYYICSAVQYLGLIQLSSKSALIALFITLIAGFPLFVLKKENRHLYLLKIMTASFLLIIFVLCFHAFRVRYLTTLQDDLYENRGIVKENGRVDRWNTAFELIRKAPVMGSGAGSEIPLLRNLYYEKKMYESYLFSLNAHNQYLSFLINSGVIGLLVYVATLAWGLWESVKRRDVLLFGFILLVSVVSLSEDLLDVNKGIFFYAFFFSFFVLSGKQTITRPQLNSIATPLMV
jgi:O-antigen ligase